MKNKVVIELTKEGFYVDDKADAFMIGHMERKNFEHNWKFKKDYHIEITIHTKQGMYTFDVTKKFFKEMKRKLFYFVKIHLEGDYNYLHKDIKSKDILWSLKNEK